MTQNKMVEGPQSSYLAKQILKRFKNKKLQQAKIRKGRYKKHSLKNWKEFQNDFPLILKDVYKKGKVLFLFFTNGWTMIVKFGMTGLFYFDQKDADADIVFDFENGPLYFFDQRHFGTITITKDGDLVINELEKIAPDILDKRITFSDVKDRIQSINPNATLDTVLMDQKMFLSGIGNIIKSEVLYDAKISPVKQVKNVSEQEWKKLFSSSKKITNKVYNEIVKNSENEFFKIQKVYQQEKDPKGNKVERYESKDGRVTFWVPNVQK